MRQRHSKLSKSVRLVTSLVLFAVQAILPVFAQTAKASERPLLQPLTITPAAPVPGGTYSSGAAPAPVGTNPTTQPTAAKLSAKANFSENAVAKITKAWSISANKVESSLGSDLIVAHGAARISIADQNSILFADNITYNRTTEIVDASGHVSIIRDHVKTTGSQFKFKINSDEYLITQPDVCVGMPKLIARLAQPLAQSIKPPSAVSEIDKFLDDDSEDDMPGLFGGAMKKLLDPGR